MSEHTVTIDWKRETPDFDYKTYNRDHDWIFDAGVTVRASATPRLPGQRAVRRSRGGVRRQPVELPHADVPGDLLPEAGSSWTATGMRRSESWRRTRAGRLAMTKVTLRPKVTVRW